MRSPAVSAFDISAVGRVFSLQGLENFTAIRKLNLHGLWQGSVDVSPFADLEELDCGDSRLTAIDLRSNPKLRVLNVGGSNLTSLDVNENAQLADLNCASCSLTNLNIGQGPALESLSCEDNRLTGLSLGQAPLRVLRCSGNSLASIDISACPKLFQCLQNGYRVMDSGTVSVEIDDDALVFDANCRVVYCGDVLHDPQAALALEANKIDLGVGETWTALSVRSGITASECTFASDNAKDAAVTSAGIVKAKKKGNTVIHVTAPNGQTAELAVNVLSAPKKVKLSAGKLTLGVAEAACLEATLPGNTASQLKWTDSNPGIVQYNGQKNLKALKTGKTTLTIQTFNTNLRLLQQELWKRFFVLARRRPAGLLDASQGASTQPGRKSAAQNCWVNLRLVLYDQWATVQLIGR